MSEIIEDIEFNERPPNAVYKCRVSQRLDGKAPAYSGGRRDTELYDIEGIEGFAYLSAEQPFRRTAPMYAPQHDSEIPLVYEFVVAGHSPQEEEAVIRVNSRNLVWLGDQ